MTPQELKNSILQLAIQGKLVEQRAEEGTATELLEKILAAKNAKDAKGKGEKSHAKSAKSAKVGSCVSREEIPDDEKPFDIPESWEWARLGELGILKSGYAFKSTEYTKDGVQVVRISDLSDDSIGLKDAAFYPHKPKLSQYFVVDGSFLICMTGSIGKMAWVKDSVLRYLNQRVGMFIPNALCSSAYLWFFLHTSYVVDKWIRAKTSTNGNIKNADIVELPIPLPPLAEQKRIVAKIEELLPLVDRYEKAWSRLEDFNKRFPADMQKSLLQLAIQGKLVEQKADEGTGAELLEKILAAKNAEGAKGKGEKSHAKSAKSAKVRSRVSHEEILDDEKPFDIPESWEWARLEDLVIKDIKRGKSPTYAQKSGTLVFAQKCNTKAGVINLSLALFLDEAKLSKYPESEFMRDCDIVINSTGNGTLGRVGIYRDSDNPNKLPVVPDSHVTVIRVGEKVSVEYVFYGLKHYQPLLEKLCSGSTNQTELSASTVKSLLFPLPPLAEQKRIVAKLEELLPLCERLKSESNSAANS